MFFVDTHIHFQDYKTQDVKNVVTNALKNNVCRFVNVSVCPKDWMQAEKLAEQHPQIIPAFGVHPWYAQAVEKDWADLLEKFLQRHKKAWVGECGIDRIKNQNITEQMEFLLLQIELAKKYNRPLVMHAVKANEAIMKIFADLPRKTVFHSFTGSQEWGKEIQKRGFYIGLNFSILKKKNYAEILQKLDINKILLETDGPYQSLEKNTETLPQNLPDLARKIAGSLQINTELFKDILYRNWMNFYGENDG